ncbi:MAG: glycoside hydrolase family 25 protein [Prevotella sp.]|nr:glycoside hydrolase family 25 protein [Prevotella sp.]
MSAHFQIMKNKKRKFSKIPKTFWWALGIIVSIAYCWTFFFFFVEPFGFRWRALYGDPTYPEGYEIHGIDISHHQGKIDWNKLGNAMIDRNYVRFVMVKATEGSDYIDECFEENFKKARLAGFIRGAYHYWSNMSTAREQAYFFLDKVHLEAGDLPPVLDVESKPDNMSDEDFQLEVLAWLHIVEDKYHAKPIIYTYYKFKEKYLNDSRFASYPYWIAHYYVQEVQYQGPWKFWQHTDVGRLPGIKGYVDLDIYNGSHYDLKKLTLSEENFVVPDIHATDSLELDSMGIYEENDSDTQLASSFMDSI